MDTVKLRNSHRKITRLGNVKLSYYVGSLSFRVSRPKDFELPFFLTAFFHATHDKVSKIGLLVVYIGRVQPYQSINPSINQSINQSIIQVNHQLFKNFSFSICRVIVKTQVVAFRQECLNLCIVSLRS